MTRIDRVTGTDIEPGLEHFVREAAVVFHADEGELTAECVTLFVPPLPRRISLWIERVLAQPALDLPCSGNAGFDRLEHLAETGGSEHAELRAYQHIARAHCLDLPQRLPVDQYGQHLLRNSERGSQILDLVQRELHVDRDHDVDVHLAKDINWQVADETAIDKQSPVNFDGRKNGRYRHARPDCGCQVASGHYVLVTRRQVGRNRAERDGQLIEVLDVSDLGGQALQYQAEALTLDDAARQLKTAIGKTDVRVDGKTLLILFAAETRVAAPRLVGQCGTPIHSRYELLQFGDASARGIQTTNDGTHAGTDDGIDGDTLAFEFLEHADVRNAARTTTAEYQPHSWPIFRGLPRVGYRIARRRRGCSQQQGNGKELAASDSLVHCLEPWVRVRIGPIIRWLRAKKIMLSSPMAACRGHSTNSSGLALGACR
jgi:hypothetical protein